MRSQAGVDRLKPVPPMHANAVVGQALSPANLFGQMGLDNLI